MKNAGKCLGTNQNKQNQVSLIGLSVLGVACTQKN